MKKNLIMGLGTAALLFVSSCSQDDLMPGVSPEGSSDVNFSVGIDGLIHSRTFADGLTATKLQYAVYLSDGSAKTLVTSGNQDFEGLSTQLSLTLSNGSSYSVVFWAAAPESPYSLTFSDNEASMAADYSRATANADALDAFYKTVDLTVNGSNEVSVKLERPFAQINLGTSDWDDADIKPAATSISASNAYTALDLLTGEVKGDASTVTLGFGEVPSADENFPKGDEYRYLAMGYFLTPTAQTLSDITFAISSEADGSKSVTRTVTSAPMQRNYRTNIYGKILTSNLDFTIDKEPNFSGELDYENLVTDGVSLDVDTKTFSIASKEGLLWFINSTNTPNSVKVNDNSPIEEATMKSVANSRYQNYTVKIIADIDMGNASVTPIQFNNPGNGFAGTVDGCGHTISNLKYSTTKQGQAVGFIAYLYGTVRNLTIDNATYSGINYVGGIVGAAYGSIYNCHVKNSNITANIYTDKGEGSDVGGIVGYIRDADIVVENSSVINTVVKGSRDVAGVVGKYQGTSSSNTHITGCTLSNVEIICSWPADYAEKEKVVRDGAPTYGKIAGYIMSPRVAPTSNEDSSNPDNNYLTNVTLTVLDPDKADQQVNVASVASLHAALEGGMKNITVAPGIYGALDFNDNKITVDEAVIDANGATFVGNNLLWMNPNVTLKNAVIRNTTSSTRYVAGKFEGCTFDGEQPFYNYYTKGDLAFTRCKFLATGERAFHLGENTATVTITDCDFSGYCPVSAEVTLIISNSRFTTNAAGFGGIGLRGDSKLTACEFNIGGEYDHDEIALKTADKKFEFTDCKVNGEKLTSAYKFTVDKDNTPVTIDGQTYTLRKTDGLPVRP